MMEFVPEKVDRMIVINVFQGASALTPPTIFIPGQPVSAIDSFVGGDFVVGLHNWLISTQLKYLAFDLQDEKEVPVDFLEELMQLMRRLRIPFFFAGVMDRPRAILESYAYTTKYPIFVNVEELSAWMTQKQMPLLNAPFEGIHFGTPIEMIRSRLNGKPEEGEEAAADLDE